ncbi:MAG: 5-oxoprolinase subunit PxpB [Vicinamibacterales bacterium]
MSRRVRIVQAGDAALVAEFDARIEAGINARALALAGAIRADRLGGVLDVVPAFRTVTVYFDPLTSDLDLLVAAIRRHAAEEEHAPAQQEPRAIEVPVCYGGELGPDLPDVARRAGLSEREVVERHAAVVYRVYMLGFVPGFAYLGRVDPAIAVPRRSSPRTHVPTGSVAIADELTAVYPGGTPGGWQIIGCTRVRPYRVGRRARSGQAGHALFTPGDAVRFLPIDRAAYDASATEASDASATEASTS